MIMNKNQVRVAIVISVLIAALAACQKEQGPAEKAGKAIDNATEKAGKAVDNAADKAGQQIEKVGEDIQDAAKGNKK
jgi:hypothetical protein